MFCIHCGFQLKESNKFCPQCGNPVSMPQVDFSLADEYLVENKASNEVDVKEPQTNKLPKDDIQGTNPSISVAVQTKSIPAKSTKLPLDWQKIFDLKNIWSVVLIAALVLSMLIFPIIKLETYKYTYYDRYEEELKDSYDIDMLGEETDFNNYDDKEEVRELDDLINTSSKTLFLVTIGSIIAYTICLIKNDSRAKSIISVVLFSAWVIYILAIFGLTGSSMRFSIYSGHGYASGRLVKIYPETGLIFSMICVIGIVISTNIKVLRPAKAKSALSKRRFFI